MNAATLKALRGSIRKWKRIESGRGVDEGTNNCPLCAMYFIRKADGSPSSECCVGCPVSQAAGDTLCRGTPYAEWAIATLDQEFPICARRNNQKAAARKFRLWLEALLPKKGKK